MSSALLTPRSAHARCRRPADPAIDGGYRRSVGRPADGHPVRGACTAASGRGGKTESSQSRGFCFSFLLPLFCFVFISARRCARAIKVRPRLCERAMTHCLLSSDGDQRSASGFCFFAHHLTSPACAVLPRGKMLRRFARGVRSRQPVALKSGRSGIELRFSDVPAPWTAIPLRGRSPPSIRPPSEIMSDCSNLKQLHSLMCPSRGI